MRIVTDDVSKLSVARRGDLRKKEATNNMLNYDKDCICVITIQSSTGRFNES